MGCGPGVAGRGPGRARGLRGQDRGGDTGTRDGTQGSDEGSARARAPCVPSPSVRPSRPVPSRLSKLGRPAAPPPHTGRAAPGPVTSRPAGGAAGRAALWAAASRRLSVVLPVAPAHWVPPRPARRRYAR